MTVAEVTAKMSYSERAKVGSVIVVDNGIISSGYNGTAVGMDNKCCDLIDGQLVTKTEVIHSERNALNRAEERNISCVGGSIFQTLSPCIACGVAIIKSGIDSVYYRDSYRDDSGIKLLLDNNIIVTKV
jgi:dCMP deaminase